MLFVWQLAYWFSFLLSDEQILTTSILMVITTTILQKMSWAIHRLIQEVIRESIMKDIGQKAWGELLVTAMNNEVTSKDYHEPHVRKINDVYIPHIRHVIAKVDWCQMDSM